MGSEAVAADAVGGRVQQQTRWPAIAKNDDWPMMEAVGIKG
jgi:hypothetical protein